PSPVSSPYLNTRHPFTARLTHGPSLYLFFFTIRTPPRPPLFPYTTLFRSHGRLRPGAHAAAALPESRPADPARHRDRGAQLHLRDRKSTRLNSSHVSSSYAVFCLKKKTTAARHPSCSQVPPLALHCQFPGP